MLLIYREYGNKRKKTKHYYGESIINEQGLRIYKITIEIDKFWASKMIRMQEDARHF